MTHLNDGAHDHQPRMYDQYAAFYNHVTCIGAKANICFSTKNRVILNSGHDAAGAQTLSQICPPAPNYVGFMRSTWDDQHDINDKFDSLHEKKEIVVKRLLSQDKPQYFTRKWSLNKEPTRKMGLITRGSEIQGSWGHDFAVNGPATQNNRYLHLFAHPTSIDESGVDSNAVQHPIDVAVDIEYICVLSDRKEVVQS
jgi:hypothetical protein